MESLTGAEYLDCSSLVKTNKTGTHDIDTTLLLSEYKVVKNPHIVAGFDKALLILLTGPSLSIKVRSLLVKAIYVINLLKVSEGTSWYQFIYRLVYINIEGQPIEIEESEMCSYIRAISTLITK